MTRRKSAEPAKVWWKAEEGEVHKLLVPYVQEIDRRQLDHFDRFVLLDALYDPNGRAAMGADRKLRAELERITENVIASNVDTVRSAVAATEVRSRMLTDGASWAVARRAALLESYIEYVAKLTDRGEACCTAFFDTALKGTGIVKVFADQDKQVRVEALMPDNIVVDDAECINGAAPRQLHYRQVDRDRDQLIQQFPDAEEAITKASSGGRSWGAALARWSPAAWMTATRNDVPVIESWRLPMGNPEDEERYVPGMHAIVVPGGDLLVEPWHKPYYPLAVMRWGLRRSSWYGIGLAERIIGHQRVINKRGWHMERVLDRLAVPTTYVSMADQQLRSYTTDIGRVVPIKGQRPDTHVPTVIGNELPADRIYHKQGAFEETGVSRMAATSTKPAGLDSGVALREWRDMGTDRFSMQEKAFERLNRDVDILTLAVCKDLGDDAPMMTKLSRYAPRKIGWPDVEIDDVRVQISSASTIPRSSAGREQTVMEFVQAGIFDLDEARELLDRPDVEKRLSLYTGARRVIEMALDGIEDGHPVVPEPFDNLAMAEKLGLAKYNELREYPDVPESVLEGVRTYIVLARHRLSSMLPAGAPPGMPPGPPAPTPQQVPSSGPPLLPAGGQPAPAGAPPVLAV